MPRARVQQRARGPQSYGGRGGPLHRSRHSLAADLSRPPFELANPALAAISTRLALRTCSMVATRTANLSRCVLRCRGSRWTNSSLPRLWPSGSVAERIDNAFLERWAEFVRLAWMTRHDKTLFLPEMSPHSGECVAEGGAAFVIPGRAHNGPACCRAELCGEQGHEGEEGLSRDWGSCRDGCWRMRIVGGLEALPEAGAERAVVDGAADLEQQVGPAPGPAHLLRLGHAPVNQEIGRALGQ